MNCRGHYKRVQIVQENYVKPLAQLKLLNGKVLPGDAGKEIKDVYFIFECKSKSTSNLEYIYCGRYAAEDFCIMTNQTLPKLFNPLVAENYNGEHRNNDEFYNENVGTIYVKKWNEARKQLYNAVMIIISAWNAKPGTALFEIKEFLENNSYIQYKPPLGKIKAVNTIIGKSSKTMREIIEELSMENDLREYSFDLLVEELRKNNVDQYFEKK